MAMSIGDLTMQKFPFWTFLRISPFVEKRSELLDTNGLEVYYSFITLVDL